MSIRDGDESTPVTSYPCSTKKRAIGSADPHPMSKIEPPGGTNLRKWSSQGFSKRWRPRSLSQFLACRSYRPMILAASELIEAFYRSARTDRWRNIAIALIDLNLFAIAVQRA